MISSFVMSEFDENGRALDPIVEGVLPLDRRNAASATRGAELFTAGTATAAPRTPFGL